MPAVQGMTFKGINEMQVRLNSLEPKYIQKIMFAIDAVLAKMVNWTKANHINLGGWQNQTGNLEKSIQWIPSVYDGKSIVGYILADREYAIYVEFREGHWVLSGTINNFKNDALKMIADSIRRQA